MVYADDAGGERDDDGGRSSQMKWSREVGGEIDATTQRAHAPFSGTLDGGDGDQHSMLDVARRGASTGGGEDDDEDDEGQSSEEEGTATKHARFRLADGRASPRVGAVSISDLFFKLRSNIYFISKP